MLKLICSGRFFLPKNLFQNSEKVVISFAKNLEWQHRPTDLKKDLLLSHK